MSARHKLNAAYLTGNLLLSGVAGALFSSGTVFVVTFLALAALSLHAGELRANRRQ